MEPSISLKSFHGFCVMVKVVPIDKWLFHQPKSLHYSQARGRAAPIYDLLMLYVIISRRQVSFVYVW